MEQKRTLNYGFIGRPVAALCVCAALLCIGAIVIFERGRTGPGMSGQDFYAVSLKHYGMDAREMERSVTIPLEDALYALPGVKQVTSVSDNAQSRVSVLFEAGRRGDREGRYEAVSDAAQRVYETLPESAQRPEILSHDDNRAPVWTAAVTGGASLHTVNTTNATDAANTAMDKARLAAFLERTVKGELEAVEGVAEARIAGAALHEVFISLDNELCARMGLSAQTVAAVLARNDVLIPAGVLESGGTEINVLVDGRYRDIDELSGAFIPLPNGGYTQLRNIAAVTERERQPDILSRLNGEQTVMLIVTASPDADLGQLSRNLARNIERYRELSFEILSDRGKEEIKALHSVIAAALGGALMVAVLSVLMTAGSGGIRQAAACALTVPFISVLSFALLSLFQPPGKSTLIGLTAGLGVAVDAAILVSEKLSGALSKMSKAAKSGKSGTAGAARFLAAKKQLRALIPPLTAGSATTVAALLPFAFMKNTAIEMNAEMQTIALSIGVITVVSFFTALILLPPLFMSGPLFPSRCLAQTVRAEKKKALTFSIPGTVSRHAVRFFSHIVRASVRKPGFVIALSAAITAAALIVVIMNDPDTRMPFSEDSLYAQVEFDGGLLKEEADRKLAAFAGVLRQNDGVKHVETGAKTGTGNVSITFDPKKITPEKIREIARNADIPGGFVYIDELTGGERNWRISVSGDDDAQCRLIARNIAEICAGIPLVEETVLHFKNGGPRLALKPDRERLAAAGLSFASFGDTERRAVHAPVAYKRLNSTEETGIRGETDVRIQAGRGNTTTPEKADVENITLVTGTGASVSAASLVTARTEEEVSVIRREDRRRTASLSVRTKAAGARKARSLIMPSLGGLVLPQNYTITFDREAIEAEEALGKSVFSIILALLFCYIVIAMANESFFLPLIALAAVPPSLALPVLVLYAAGFKMNAALICAFIAVTGITVNAATLTVDALRGQRGTFPAVYRALRGRLNALLATGGTTIAAALPFVFLPENTNLMIKTLALVSALGVAGSCLASVTLIPALIPRGGLQERGLGKGNSTPPPVVP